MAFVVADAHARGCSLLLHGGDVYERRSTAHERACVRAWLDAAAISDMHVVIAAGNHEAPGEVEELAGRGVYARERPGVLALHGVLLAVLPWPRREQLRAWFAARGETPGAGETDAAARAMLAAVLRGLRVEMDAIDPAGIVPRVLLAHVAVAGYCTDSDQPAVGGGFVVGVEDLMEAGADIVLLGHIHRPQEWSGTRSDGVAVPVIYAGSPRRTAYAAGELHPKGYVIVEFAGRTPTWQRVPTPATPMCLMEARWLAPGDPSPESGGVEERGSFVMATRGDHLRGGEVRFRYTVRSDQREAARGAAETLAAAWRSEGAAEVQIEEAVIPLVSARAPELAAVVDLGAQVREVLRIQEIDADRHDGIVGHAVACAEAVR